MKKMRKMKKLMAVLLSLSMLATLLVSMSASVFADEEEKTGSITISNAAVGETYTIYKLFDLTYTGSGETYGTDETDNLSALYGSEDGEGVVYTYTATSADDTFLAALQGDDSPFTLTQITTDSGYVYQVKLASDEVTAAQIAEFVKSYLATDSRNDNITSETSENVTSDDPDVTTTTVTFDGLELGYYYVTSSVGTAVSINSTISDVTITDKNDLPTVDKEVSNDNETANTTTTADIGDTVEYTITIVAGAGAESYIVHDVMSDGLTLDADSFSITLTTNSSNTTTTLTSGTDYTVVTGEKVSEYENGVLKDGATACTFEIVFDQNFLDTLKNSDEIVITYSATLNKTAVIGYVTGNTNVATLEYGSTPSTTKTSQTTNVYTYSIDVLKYVSGDTTQALLAGATFALYAEDANSNTGYSDSTLLYFTDDDNDNKYVYSGTGTTGSGSVTTDDKGYTYTNSEGDEVTVSFILSGLDAGTYYLVETSAPDGYNRLTYAVKVVIDENGTVTYYFTSNGKYTTAEDGETVYVENSTGTELPETGGIGTTVFYVIGAILVIGAGVTLVVRRRMRDDED